MADSENFPHEPEVIGSESRIYRQKDVDAAEKRKAAEVLAACLGRLGDLVISRQDAATQAGRDDKERLRQVFLDERDGLRAAIVALKELQPAASSLEALLRPGHELAELLLAWLDNQPDGRSEVELKILEKARAIVEGE